MEVGDAQGGGGGGAEVGGKTASLRADGFNVAEGFKEALRKAQVADGLRQASVFYQKCAVLRHAGHDC